MRSKIVVDDKRGKLIIDVDSYKLPLDGPMINI